MARRMGKNARGRKIFEQVDELVPLEDHAQSEDRVAEHGLHHPTEALAALGNQARVLVDERLRAPALKRHDHQFHAHEIDRSRTSEPQPGPGAAVGEHQEEAADHEADRDILAHRQGQDREDERRHRPPGKREVEGEPQEERRQRRVVKVVQVRPVQRRIQHVPHRHQARQPRSEILARDQIERDGRAADEGGLQRSEWFPRSGGWRRWAR